MIPKSVFDRLKTLLDLTIDSKNDGEYDESSTKEEPDLMKANLISSELKESGEPEPKKKKPYDGFFAATPIDEKRHMVLLDIDYPAYVVPSSTPGHYHLYLDVPGGVPHYKYMEFLQVAGFAGVVEKGYASASVARGASYLRPPWVKKGATKAIVEEEDHEEA